MMVDPVANGVNVFLGIYQCLPISIKAFISLVLILFIIPNIIRIFWNMRS